MAYNTLEEIIGNTPLILLDRINPNPKVTLLAKLELFNPSGSIKDRIVLHIINDAEKKGLLQPGGTIIENTSGNTGASAAMLAARRGYRAIFTMPDKVSKEKQDALKAYGAEIIICPTDVPADSPENYVNKAKELAANCPGSFRIDQYDNLKNPEAHYLSTGPEIWQQTNGSVNIFIAAASTGGSISGAAKYLKEQNKDVRTIMPDPVGSVYYSYFKTGKIPENARCTYQVEGIGEDHITKAIDFSVIDDVVQVSDQDSFATCRLLAEKEGILTGGSSGTNVFAAIAEAKKAVKPTVIVTLLPDWGIKYLSKIYN